MKILLVDSCYPINNRNLKILNSLKNRLGNNIEIFVCTWNRDGRVIDTNYSELNLNAFNKKADYGKPLAKIKGIIPYFKFIKRLNEDIKPNIIVASHWDMLCLVSLIKKHNQKLVYENLDLPTSSSFFFRNVFRFFEELALIRTNAIIFASRFFIDKYAKFKKTKIVLENLPFKDVVVREYEHNYESNKLKISFIGTLRYFNVMKNLIDAAKGLPVEILFWGDGPDENKLKEYSRFNNSVKFFGKYEYKTISDIYALSDVVWAVYPSSDYNVKYAISNKFHECLIFKRPGVFAEGTMLGELVEKEKIGYIVNPYSVTNIQKLFVHIIEDKAAYNELQINLVNSMEKKTWEDEEYKLIDLFLKF